MTPGLPAAGVPVPPTAPSAPRAPGANGTAPAALPLPPQSRSAARWRTTLARRLADLPSGSWGVEDVAGGMTLAILLLKVDAFWYLQAPIGVLALSALIHRPLLRSAAFWLAVTAVLAAGHSYLWFSIDNHMYLLTYWCLALGLSRLAQDPAQTLATNARYLIGLCFLFATLWKLISPDFANGTFFQFTLLTDHRFGGVASIVAGAPEQIASTHDRVLGVLQAYDGDAEWVQLHTTSRVPIVASFLAIWTILIEGAIALAFLWPRDRFLSKGRDLLLAAFLITCYPIATVVGFAWLLTAMGFAQARATPPAARLLYIAAFLLMPLYEHLPFRSLFALILG